MNKCARCEKTVYPTEELKCLDKVWHKVCFKCDTCSMPLTMKNYKGFSKIPYCDTHYPKVKPTTVSETPEGIRLAKNTALQSQVKYHEDFEKAKGKLTQVADDPETVRIRNTHKIISNVSYHGDLEKKKQMEEKRVQANEFEGGVMNGTPDGTGYGHGMTSLQIDMPPPKTILPNGQVITVLHTTATSHSMSSTVSKSSVGDMTGHSVNQRVSSPILVSSTPKQPPPSIVPESSSPMKPPHHQVQQTGQQSYSSSPSSGPKQVVTQSPIKVPSQYVPSQPQFIQQPQQQQPQPSQLQQQQPTQIRMNGIQANVHHPSYHNQAAPQQRHQHMPPSRPQPPPGSHVMGPMGPSHIPTHPNGSHSMAKFAPSSSHLPTSSPSKQMIPLSSSSSSPQYVPHPQLPVSTGYHGYNNLVLPRPFLPPGTGPQPLNPQQQQQLFRQQQQQQQQQQLYQMQQNQMQMQRQPQSMMRPMGQQPPPQMMSSYGPMGQQQQQQTPPQMSHPQQQPIGNDQQRTMVQYYQQQTMVQQVGPTGAAPVMRAKPITVRAIYDYTAQDVDEVSFCDGDIIVACNPIDVGWMTGTVQRTGKRGMIPSNYVETVQD